MIGLCTWKNGWMYNYEGTYARLNTAVKETNKLKKEGKKTMIRTKRNAYGKKLFTVWSCKWAKRYY